ncbi:MAG TPA: CHRD domain-containing protein [Ktedonobacteraceae bacterium]|jgi:hypothetical protein
MQEHMDDWSNTRDRPPDKKSRTRSMFLRFLFGVSGFVLLTVVAAGAMVPQLLDMHNTYAHAHNDQDQTTQSNTSGQATLKLDPNAHTLSIQAKVSNAPLDTPLVMHVHGGGSCTGPILFLLQATSSDAGRASTSMTFSIDENDTTLPNNWFFNVHDTTRQDADGKPLSIACGPIKVDSSGLKGRAQLRPVQQQTVEGLNQTTQSNTSGLTTLLLNPTAHTLTVQAIVFGAPPDIPLVLHVHGGGSCTGPILFPLQATSDDAGHASATMTFNDPQDSTIPNNWFFNVHDATRQGSDGKPLSIACGPIQTIDSTIAFAKLNPVQSTPGNPTPVQTTTQSTTEGITTIQLDPSTHTLAVEAIVFGAPLNTPLVMHIHGGGSCTGPILFPLQATSDNAGNAFATMTFNDPQDSTIPNNWFFNVHDTTRQDADGKPLSIACGPIQVTDPSGLTGHALLCPVQPSQTTVPTVTPLTTITSPTSPTTAPATQNTTQGLTVLYLNAAAHTLTVLSHVVGAPPNTPLTMNIHGGGSCTGPTLFMLQTTSDSAGNATAIMPFNDTQDTTVSNQWFFDVDNATKQGPDGKPLSIACGPVQAAGQVGLAQLNLFQLPQLPQQLN